MYWNVASDVVMAWVVTLPTATLAGLLRDLQTSFLVLPAGVTFPPSIALCDEGGRPVHGGVNE